MWGPFLLSLPWQSLFLTKRRKNKFSAFKLELRDNVEMSFPEIKKVGNKSDTGSHHADEGRSRYESSAFIKSKKRRKTMGERIESCFVRPVCVSTDARYIRYLNGRPYCRRAVSFRRDLADPKEFSARSQDFEHN